MSARHFQTLASGAEQYFHYDEDTDSFTIETVHDVTDIVEDNKALLADEADGWKGDMHRIASIPLSLYFELRKKGIVKDQKAFRRWLDDPENRHFRTKAGKLYTPPSARASSVKTVTAA